MTSAFSFGLRALAAAAAFFAALAPGAHAQAPPEATTFDGRPIARVAPAPEVEADALAKIAAIEANPAPGEFDFVRLGELYVSIGRFQDGIAAFTRGLQAHPQSYKLRRHRGHRLINVRALDRAIVDLQEAVRLMPEAPEPEIRLNDQAYGTYQHWIWYHVGLHRYLTADYAGAAEAYENAVRTAPTPELVIGSTDWLWNAAMRAGQTERAAAALARVPDESLGDARAGYSARVKLYKGLTTPADILDVQKADWTGADSTTAYGVANWHAFRGETEAADRILRRIVATPFWSSWAFVAAERDLTR